jgi:hypothetical protein
MQRLVCLTGLVAAVLVLDVTNVKAAVLTVYYDFEGVGDDRFYDPAGDFNDNLTGRYNSAFSNDVSSNAMGSAQSADFNGDSVLFTDAFTTDLGPDRDAYTLMFWVKAADAQQGGGSRRLISTRVLPDGSEGNASWQVEGFGGGGVDNMDLRYQSAGYPANWWNPDAVGALAVDQAALAWHHVAFVVANSGGPGDAAFGLTYVDGVSVGTAENNSALWNGADLRNLEGQLVLGGDAENVGNYGYTGLLDDVALFAGIVSAGDIAAIAGGTVSPDSLVAGGAVVPEPSSIAMFGIGALGLFGYSRRRRQTSAAA